MLGCERVDKIKDRLLLGVIAGFGANLVKEAIAETAIRSGITKYSCRRVIAEMVLSPEDAKSWKGWIVGTTTDFTVAGLIGILTVFTLTQTGRDYGWMKSVMISNGILDQVFNAMARVLPKVRNDANSNILCKGIHTVFGLATALIIDRIGSPSVFEKHNSLSEKDVVLGTDNVLLSSTTS